MKRRDFLTAIIAAPITTLPLASVATAKTALPVAATKPTNVAANLKMFSNDVDYVIAESVANARWLVAEHYYGDRVLPRHLDDVWEMEEGVWGYCSNDIIREGAIFPRFSKIYYDELDGFGDWEEYPMDKEFKLWEEYPGNNEVAKPAREWIDEHGPGYFACSEY